MSHATRRERVALGLDPKPPFSLSDFLKDVVVIVAFAVIIPLYFLALWVLETWDWLRGR